MKKIPFISIVIILILSLSGCNGQSANSTVSKKSEDKSATAIIEEKWEDEDGSYLATDEFKEDLDEISDDVYEKATDTGGYTSKEEHIWKYCMDRWEHYDNIEGGYSGDKYTKNVFQDAATEFNITNVEAENIWNKVDRAKLEI
jgi:hypothetical protein